MCNAEKLTHLVIVKSRHVELFLLKKNDFLKLSYNYKEFINNFLQKSINLYIKLSDEKKSIIEQYESQNSNEENADLHQNESISDDYNVFDNHSLFSDEENLEPDKSKTKKNSNILLSAYKTDNDSKENLIEENIRNNKESIKFMRKGSLEKKFSTCFKEMQNECDHNMHIRSYMENLTNKTQKNFKIDINNIIKYLETNKDKVSLKNPIIKSKAILLLKKLSNVNDSIERRNILDKLNFFFN